MYGWISQIRRNAVLIPSNIAEGSARNSNKIYVQFFSITLANSLNNIDVTNVVFLSASFLIKGMVHLTSFGI